MQNSLVWVWFKSLLFIGLNWTCAKQKKRYTRKLILDIYRCIRSCLVYWHSLYLFCLFAGKQTSVCVCTACASMPELFCSLLAVPYYKYTILYRAVLWHAMPCCAVCVHQIFYMLLSTVVFVNIYWIFAILNGHVFARRCDLRRQISSCGKVILIWYTCASNALFGARNLFINEYLLLLVIPLYGHFNVVQSHLYAFIHRFVFTCHGFT